MLDRYTEDYSSTGETAGNLRRWHSFETAYREVLQKVGDERHVFVFHDMSNALTALTPLGVFPPYDYFFDIFSIWRENSGVSFNSLLRRVQSLPDNTASTQQVEAMLLIGLRRMDETLRPYFQKTAKEQFQKIKPGIKNVLSALLYSTEFLKNPDMQRFSQLDTMQVNFQDVIDYFSLAKSSVITVTYDPAMSNKNTLDMWSFTVLFNLLHNATKFAQGVTVRVLPHGITVENPAKHAVLDTVFDVGAKEENEKGGHGYGLAIAKLFAQLGGKELKLESIHNSQGEFPYRVCFVLENSNKKSDIVD